MLTRAARRRHALRYFEHAAEAIQLPWLCPALNVAGPSMIQKRETSTRPSLPQSKRAISPCVPSRTLASAAPTAEDFDLHDEYLPFAYERHSSAQNRPTTDPLPPFDISNILMIDQTTAPPEAKARYNHSTDLRGYATEIESTLEACLQVQRWNRAFHLLRQLTAMYIGNTIKLQQVYNRVLEAMVLDLIWHRDAKNQEKINQWVEVHMHQAGVEPNAQTFALKIKAALATLQGSRRDRTVTRYWEMAKQYQFENQVASLRDILSDSDLGKLSEICPVQTDLHPEEDLYWDESADLSQANLAAFIDPTQVRETDQKGLGLVSLRQSLSLFTEHGKASLTLDEEEASARLRQLRLEQDSLQSAVDRWKIEHEKRMKMGVSGNMQQGRLGALTWQWHESLAQKIDRELVLVDEAEASHKHSTEQRLRCEYGPFLRLLSSQHMAALTTLSLLQIMSKMGIGASIRLARLVTELGKAVEMEVESQHKKTNKTIKKAKADQADVSNAGSDNILPETSLHRSHFGRSPYWTSAIRAKVGAILCELMFEVAKVPVPKDDTPEMGKTTLMEPVFRRQLAYVHGRTLATVTLHPVFGDMMTKQPPAALIAKQLPMVSKPQPWTGFTEGGYYETVQPMLRVKSSDVAQRDYAETAAERGDLDQLFIGLDVLGSTGWKINRDVFNVMLEAWNSGEAVANLPPINKVFPKVEKPAEDATPLEKWKYFNQMRLIENEKGGLHSNRCFQNFQMEIARSYLDETFYLPHNVDFRGRAYPIPPYLNQMGADNARGLLLFDQGRALGADGLRWLQIHLANVFGFDKASLSDRAQFALDHIEDVRDSVQKPLDGKRWWLKAEDPWQCLATCQELVKALDSPDPSAYVSHLPVHQDGTCNGLQHYAALGGDLAGARHVNLEPGDKPADVYSGVLELVKAEIKQDAEQGLEIAKLLDGRLTRKIVKQTVMTNVYGVTFTGAIRQVRKQVDDLLPDINKSGQGGQAATYIARKIFRSLGTLFEGAHDIQYWLGDCANRITHSISPAQLEQIARKEFGGSRAASNDEPSGLKRKKRQTDKVIDAADFRSTIVWTTPLKLPVVQPYRTSSVEKIRTSAQGLSLVQPGIADAVDPRKQLQAFPPNFIHSLDATHMMLSAIKARELGLTFSAVHDSFWTHAADINQLNVTLRDEFIRMHADDIIGRLAAEFSARYKGHFYLAKIGSNNKLAREIRQYRLNLEGRTNKPKEQKYWELVREVRRAKLLASADPQERAEGEQMVTAATLFEKHQGDQFLPQQVSLGQTAIGEVPRHDPLEVEDALGIHGLHGSIAEAEQSALDPSMQADPLDMHDQPTRARSKSQSKHQPVWLWLPLTFKDVPQKGEFRVERLRDSTYFFS